MRLAELATRLKVQPDSLRVQVHRGALVAVKEGRDWFVTVEEAARYEREQAGKRGAGSPRHSRIGNRHPRKKNVSDIGVQSPSEATDDPVPRRGDVDASRQV